LVNILLLHPLTEESPIAISETRNAEKKRFEKIWKITNKSITFVALSLKTEGGL